ncbi:MAG: SDR family oxidoreductase [Acidobacteria bacterium]|nr:SDR family oxidoreductase [Acidobacteriota bacterium]MCI0721459.1 SDR family oxidoreductase [Acidobacteriota bacterium]
MRVLVTGGAGFIGSHLCELLVKANHEVICMDNYFTGSKKNVYPLLHRPGFEIIRHDIINPIDVEADQIYNLACPASPVFYQFNPVRTIQANVLGVTNMLELAKRTKARILQASTSEIYGDPHVHPQREDYWGNVNPIGVRSCYDEGKRVAEALMMDYHRQFAVDIRIVRIFNTYGPRMALNDGRVVSNFIVQALRGEDITIYGKGEQTRSFCYVSDLVGGLVAMMNADNFIGPVNIGNPGEFTILGLAERVIRLTGSPSRIIFKELPLDDPVRRRPDISLAKAKLGWAPTIEIDAGLERTLDYFRETIKGG